jgi:hypothetical protein
LTHAIVCTHTHSSGLSSFAGKCADSVTWHRSLRSRSEVSAYLTVCELVQHELFGSYFQRTVVLADTAGLCVLRVVYTLQRCWVLKVISPQQ